MDRFETSVPGTFDGGCLCGAVRYRIGDPYGTGYCHCAVCRRMSGGPGVIWTSVEEGKSSLLDGSPLVYRSSDRARRPFCGACGPPLLLLYADTPGLVLVPTATPHAPARGS